MLSLVPRGEKPAPKNKYVTFGDFSLRLRVRAAVGEELQIRGLDDLHAALFKESRTRARRQQREVGSPWLYPSTDRVFSKSV